MAGAQRVYWGEGMLLSPQHFQQWERYHEHQMRRRIRSQQVLDWGMLELAIDAEALLGGELRVERCAGVFGDGMLFDAPERDRVPAPRRFKEWFDPGVERLGVHLAVPLLRSGGVACVDGEGAETVSAPFRRGSLQLGDDNRAGAEREVATALVNLRVVFDGEALDDFESIKIAELERTATGGYALSKSFVPPCLYLAVSDVLMHSLRGIVEIVTHKSESLSGQQRKSGGMAEAFAFWLLHTVNAHLPGLVHLYNLGRVHPERVYLELARLAGELCTFSPDVAHPRELPQYDHGDLGGCFAAMLDRLRRLLDAAAPNKCVPIPLERIGESIFAARLNDLELVQAGQLYVAVLADVPEEKLIVEIPAKAKVSSKDRVNQLIAMALRGLAVRHAATPPEAIPRQPGRVYYKLEKVGEHWEEITKSHTISIQIPPEYPGLKLELMAVKE